MSDETVIRTGRLQKAMDELAQITDASDTDETWDEVMLALRDPRSPMPPNERDRLQKTIQLMGELREEGWISVAEYDLIFATIDVLVSHYRGYPAIEEATDATQ